MFTQNIVLRIRSTSDLFLNPKYFSFSLFSVSFRAFISRLYLCTGVSTYTRLHVVRRPSALTCSNVMHSTPRNYIAQRFIFIPHVRAV